jgi:hypothetical protein
MDETDAEAKEDPAEDKAAAKTRRSPAMVK